MAQIIRFGDRKRKSWIRRKGKEANIKQAIKRYKKGYVEKKMFERYLMEETIYRLNDVKKIVSAVRGDNELREMIERKLKEDPMFWKGCSLAYITSDKRTREEIGGLLWKTDARSFLKIKEKEKEIRKSHKIKTFLLRIGEVIFYSSALTPLTISILNKNISEYFLFSAILIVSMSISAYQIFDIMRMTIEGKGHDDVEKILRRE